MILEDYLEINAKRYPQKTAVVCGEEVCTYEALYERVLTRTEVLKNLYHFGQIVALRAYPTVAAWLPPWSATCPKRLFSK